MNTEVEWLNNNIETISVEMARSIYQDIKSKKKSLVARMEDIVNSLKQIGEFEDCLIERFGYDKLLGESEPKS